MSSQETSFETQSAPETLVTPPASSESNNTFPVTGGSTATSEPTVTEVASEPQDDGSTNPGDSDDTSTHTGDSDCECPDYPDCPPQPEPKNCKPTFVPITLEIAPVVDLLVNKPKVCVVNKATCKPCFFLKHDC